MELGPFSLSLAVKDIAAARAFYEGLGFSAHDDHHSDNWLILRNGTTTIGLFQGMFDANILTFHPTDVRAIQRHLREQGLELINEADETTSGPAHVILNDPDGNTILLDQIDPAYRPTSAS